ncbi:3-hydroxyacyl-CoA dehydrogenase family protein [Catellatospora methionotrophica]|uniref:3-hydroxyacyl-CoA dehydrogenase family protein n=1 Tax=Catellatospora methionotrophica TaxID=121620 RepID=UPI0033CDAE89
MTEGNVGLAVIGAGVMGTGIAALASGSGVPVVLVDVDPAALERAERAIGGHIRMGQLYGKLSRTVEAGPVRYTGVLADAADADVVIEAIVEVTEAKAKVYAELSALVRQDAVLVTNTSGIPVDELAGHVRHPERVVGAHFMNPAYMIRTVEVIRGPRTAQDALDRLVALLTVLGDEAVVVNDGPGFVINRILQRMINESARIVSEGLASPGDVDRLFKGCLGHTTGPLATADLIGLDNVVDSLRALYERTGDPGYAPCDLLTAKVAEGDFGRKTGRGFFTY